MSEGGISGKRAWKREREREEKTASHESASLSAFEATLWSKIVSDCARIFQLPRFQYCRRDNALEQRYFTPGERNTDADAQRRIFEAIIYSQRRAK